MNCRGTASGTGPPTSEHCMPMATNSAKKPSKSRQPSLRGRWYSTAFTMPRGRPPTRTGADQKGSLMPSPLKRKGASCSSTSYKKCMRSADRLSESVRATPSRTVSVHSGSRALSSSV